MRSSVRICLLLLLLGCAACGGKGSAVLPTALGEPAAFAAPLGDLAALVPALPGVEPFVLQRVAATADVTLSGEQFDTKSDARAIPEADALKLTSVSGAPSTASGWGMYRFGGTPGEKMEAFGYSGSLLAHPGGQHVWTAISNYGKHRWEWFDGGALAGRENQLNKDTGDYSSPGGQTYILVLAYGGVEYDVHSVYVRYRQRFEVSGVVAEADGTPIAGALVATPVAQISVLSGADGKFKFGLPGGSWPLLVTKSGFTFYSNPQVVTVDPDPATGIQFTGRQNGSHFTPSDPGGYNNTLYNATPADLETTPISETLSATDDPADCFRFSVSKSGLYYIEYTNPGLDNYFPYLVLYGESGQGIQYISGALAGTMRLPLNALAGQKFIIRVTSSGGGGTYGLRLGMGACQGLTGITTDGTNTNASKFNGCLVTVTNMVQGDVTLYLTSGLGTPDLGNNFYDRGAFVDLNRAPVMTKVHASGAYLSFTPDEQTVDLSIARPPGDPMWTVTFTGTLASLGDKFEPNNNIFDAQSNAALPVPYDSSAAGDSLSLAHTSDEQDYYWVKPPAGKCLKVELATEADHVAADGQSGSLDGLTLSLLNYQGFSTVATGWRTPDGIEVRLPTATDGNGYYIRVGLFLPSSGVIQSWQRARAYSLKVSTYTGYPLSFRVNYGSSNGVAGAVVQLRRPPDAANPLAFFLHQVATMPSGITAPVYYAAGEQIQAELLRYGFDVDRQTKAITMPASSLTVAFNADPAHSADTHEPNDTLATAAPVTLAAAFDATLDPVSDPQDDYLIHMDTQDALAVKVTQNVVQGSFFMRYYQIGTDYVGHADYQPGHAPALLPTPAPGDYVLEVNNCGQAGAYHIDISAATAYHLTGHITLGGDPHGLIVYCPELEQVATLNTAVDPPEYDFGLVAPANYTVMAYAKGSQCSPPQATVAVTNADNGVDFVLTPNPVDAYEPNDDPEVDPLTLLPNDGSLSPLLSVDDDLGADPVDWYQFDAAEGQLITVQVVRDQYWWPYTDILVYNPDLSLAMGQSRTDVDTVTQMSAVVVPQGRGGRHYLRIGTVGPVEYRVRVAVSGP